MQRKLILVVFAALVALGGCAARDPNLVVRGLNQFNGGAGDYTLHVNLYDLDDAGHPRLAVADDPSLTGFVSRSLAAKGYALRADGPARYNLEIDLLCGNMRTASLGIMSEELPVPADVVGPGYSGQVHYWLPEKGLGAGSHEPQDLSDSMRVRRGSQGAGQQSGLSYHGGTPFGDTPPDFCQGRVLVALTPTASGPKREVFVARAGTDDCKAVANCPSDTCRSALEQTLVDILERRF